MQMEFARRKQDQGASAQAGQAANERRRKLKANRDKRINPSKETLALQNWQIFLTTASEQELPALLGLPYDFS